MESSVVFLTKNNFVESELFKDYFFSGDIKLIHLLALIMVVDVLTGLSKAFIDKSLWSRKSLFGYMRKILVFAIIIMANLIDTVLGFNGVLAYTTVVFYIGNELLSVIENCGQLGLPLPKKILDVLAVIQDGKTKPTVSIKHDLVGIEKTQVVQTDDDVDVIEIRQEEKQHESY